MRLTEADLAAKGYGPDGRRLNPMRVMGEPPAVEEQNTTGSDRRAVVALRTPEATGLSGLQSPTKPLSTRAIAKLQPEQQLQIEVVQLYRPLLRPDARLLGINGELPGGGKLQALRAAVRREMGYVRGQPDVLCVRPGHVLWLEAKVGADQSDEQVRFADWAHGIGHGYAVFTSVDDAGVLLRIHGMLA